MKLVGIVANTQSPLAGEGVRKLHAWLTERGVDNIIESNSNEVTSIPSVELNTQI